MFSIIIEIIIGFIAGIIFGITGIHPTALILIVLDYFKINDYKTISGSILFLNLFPLTIGSVYEFHKHKKIDYTMVLVLSLAIMIGSTIGSYYILNTYNKLSVNLIKLISLFISFITFLYFLYAYITANATE